MRVLFALKTLKRHEGWRDGGWRDGSAVKSPNFFQRTQVQFPEPTWRLTTVYSSSSGEPNALHTDTYTVKMPKHIK